MLSSPDRERGSQSLEIEGVLRPLSQSGEGVGGEVCARDPHTNNADNGIRNRTRPVTD